MVVQSFLADTPFAGLIKNGIDDTAVEGANDIPYAIPNIRVDWHRVPSRGADLVVAVGRTLAHGVRGRNADRRVGTCCRQRPAGVPPWDAR